MADIWLPVAGRAPSYFADPGTLKRGALVDALREVRPTFLFGVPRIFEKIQEKVQPTT